MTRRGLKRWAIAGLVVLAALGGLVLAGRYYDPLNVQYKRLKAENRFEFEEVSPDILAGGDPEALLTPHSAADVDARRRAITRIIYGAPERIAVPAYRSGGDSDVRFALEALPHAETVKRFYQTPRAGILSFFYLMIPKEPVPGRAAIYHNGFDGTSIQSAGLLDALMEAGVTVVAIDQLGYGENTRDAPCLPVTYPPRCVASLQFHMAKLDRPLTYHVEPVRAAVDLLLNGIEADEVHAIGFSAGAATITLAAAVDTRIKRSVAASGVLPYYLREGQDAPIGIADYGPLRDRIGMMDQFLLAAAGDGRAHMHLFNRYDRCCFRNLKGRVYEKTVQDRLEEIGLGGRFEVAIDETHARHEISDYGTETILTFLGYR